MPYPVLFLSKRQSRDSSTRMCISTSCLRTWSHSKRPSRKSRLFPADRSRTILTRKLVRAAGVNPWKTCTTAKPWLYAVEQCHLILNNTENTKSMGLNARSCSTWSWCFAPQRGAGITFVQAAQSAMEWSGPFRAFKHGNSEASFLLSNHPQCGAPKIVRSDYSSTN